MGKRVIPCGTGAIQEMWTRINQHLSGKKTNYDGTLSSMGAAQKYKIRICGVEMQHS